MADQPPAHDRGRQPDLQGVTDLYTAPIANNAGTDPEHDVEAVAPEPYERASVDHGALPQDHQLKTEKESRLQSRERQSARGASLRRTASAATSATSVSTDLEKSESKEIPGPAAGKWWRLLLLKSRKIHPVPSERQVSREYGANWLSRYTFQWVNPLMVTGYNRPLEANDIWKVNPERSVDVLAPKVQEAFDRRVASGSKRPLAGALHEVFYREFWVGGFFALLSQLMQVLSPFVLRYLIQFSTDAYNAEVNGGPPPPIGHGVGLVIGITVMQLIQSGTTSHYFYRGLIVGGQIRMTLIALILDKSMRISARARAGGQAVQDAADAADAAHAELKPPANLKPGSDDEQAWFKKILRRKAQDTSREVDIEGYSNGRIVSLMSVDTSRVDLAMGLFHLTWTSPISMIIVLVLLLINITYSALAGYGFVCIMMPLLWLAIRSLFDRRTSINKTTDQRVGLTQEILSAVRFVKYFGWETSFLDRLEFIRRREIRAVEWLMGVRNIINAVTMSVPIFASMLAFITYALTGHDLAASRIFSSLALFNALRTPLNMLPLVIGQVTDAAASIGRITDFMMAEEAADQAEWDETAKNAVVLSDATFTWERTRTKLADSDDEAQKADGDAKPKAIEGTKELDEKAPATPTSVDSERTLSEDHSRPFELKDLNLAVQRNELIAVIGSVGSGKTSLLAALAGDMRKTSGRMMLGAARAFCPQSAWIQNATVKDNILFGKEMKKKWYNAVVDACALRPDFEMFPNGELTEIGERGITVSGGQKQRLNIARAIYHDTDIVIMDDPLSAVDAHVGRHIMDNAICGLLKDKCRILATHQLWVLNRCDRVVWLQDGKIFAADTYDNLMAKNAEFKQLISNNSEEEKREKKDDEDEVEEEKKTQKKTKSKKRGAALMQAEEKAVNGVSWAVYAAYLKAAGGYWTFPVVLILLIAQQAANIVTSLWLSWWTSDQFGLSMGTYIGVYAGLGGAQALLMFVFSVALTYFCSEASKEMFHRAMTRVLRAPMSFFDTTPLGRITNRFSKDVDVMDNNLSESVRFFTLTMGMVVGVFVLIIAYYYYFAVAMVPLALIFCFSAAFYRASAREMKRHEAVLRSHVYARFTEAVTGIATIRAYGLQKNFGSYIREAIDNQAGAYFLTFANQRWLSMRIDAVGILMVFVVGILVVTARFTVNPSTGGLVLSYILSIVQILQFTIRQLAEVENNMNSTERVHYYGTAIDEEPPLHDQKVPDSWPQSGAIDFEHVEMRYRPGLPLVLRDLNLQVRGGERVGVVGRTGAGKSSIMSTLFRLVEICGGRILIDGVDIAKVGLVDLRQRLAIIPQDPTLFKGTVRSNLDPFGKYNDLELWNALRQADLVDTPASANPDAIEPASPTTHAQSRIHLDSPVDEEGANFSLGQRQLMALARALVRGSQIIVCDEATSSVDMETDAKIQKTIKRGFQGKTLLCIAHRLRTILDYDRIIVMDQGTIAEVGTPSELFALGGIFTGMCTRSSIGLEDIEHAAHSE